MDKEKIIIMGSSNNLNPFLKEKFRDVTCYYGRNTIKTVLITAAQKRLNQKLLLSCIFIFRCSETDAPIYILPTSHVYGAQKFPHEIDYKDNKIFYSPDNKRKVGLNEVKLTGNAGTVFFGILYFFTKQP